MALTAPGKRRAAQPRFQPYLSEQDMAWVQGVCGPEPDRPFRDVNSLFHHLLRAGEARIQRLRAQGVAPRVEPGEWTERLQVFISRARHEQLRRDVGREPGTIYKSASEYAADLVRLGRLLAPALLDLEQNLGREKLETAPRG